MEVRIFDGGMNLISIIENHTSLLWRRLYNEPGNFTLTCPITKANVDCLKPGNIVWVKGKADAGLIEQRILDQSGHTNRIQATGRFLPAILNRRLIYPTSYFNGKTEEIMRSMFSQAVAFPNVVLGELQGFDETVEFQALYKNLLTYEENLAKSANFGFRFRPNFGTKMITFEIYKGLDRTKSQTDRPRVVFSEEYENLNSIKYTENTQLHKNVCVIGGQENEGYKYYETVGDTTSTGYNRRETYYEASDVSSEGLTWAQYVAALRAKGQMVLDQSRAADTFECTIRINGNFVYGRDYDVGDVVTIEKPSWGLSKDMRLTEVTEVYETEIPRLDVVLGDPLPTTINWEV